ncbi:MAG TPA: (4Fe-4S)-binding protein [Fimbriimonas sp.]|nr:(4Fe-4S)-binding protein [Fimbriimonas sp.]
MDKAHVKRDYESDQLIVHWDSSKCSHSGKCVHGLPQVFNLKKHPWIDVTGATAEELIDQVSQCPSGALTVTRKD